MTCDKFGVSSLVLETPVLLVLQGGAVLADSRTSPASEIVRSGNNWLFHVAFTFFAMRISSRLVPSASPGPPLAFWMSTIALHGRGTLASWPCGPGCSIHLAVLNTRCGEPSKCSLLQHVLTSRLVQESDVSSELPRVICLHM